MNWIFSCCSLPAVTYTSETGQLKIINSQSLRIFHFLNEWNTARWGTFCSQQEHQRVQRLWSNDCRYANSALPISVKKHPPCYCRLRTTVCVSLSFMFSQRQRLQLIIYPAFKAASEKWKANRLAVRGKKQHCG